MGLFFIGLGLLKLLVTVFVVLLFVKLARRLAEGIRQGHARFSALGAEDALRRRFARGEIEAAEYRERLLVLRENG